MSYYLGFVEKVRSNVQSLLDILTELGRLLYFCAQSHSPRLVLHLHNTAFLNAMLCREIIGLQPQVLASRKFYRRYWRSITAHAAKQKRINAGRVASTEEEERQSTTKLTNRRPGDIITHSLVRLQGEHMAKSRQASAVKAQET